MDQLISILGTGHLIGDCIGIQYEPKVNKSRHFFLNILYEPHTFNRIKGEKKAVIGQWSDNAEIVLCILNSLKKNDFNYNKQDTIRSYLEWANSKPYGIGKNTRKLFLGIKTLQGYNTRVRKMKQRNSLISQSNESLMRAFPLFFAKNYEEAIVEDCKITNDNEINIECSKIYLSILKSLSKNENLDIASNNEIIMNIINCAKNDAKERRIKMKFDLKKCRWVVYSLYFSVYAALVQLSCFDIYEQIIELRIDPDTNGAIVGVIVAIRYKDNFLNFKMIQNWKDIIFNCDTSNGDFPRPDKYNPKNFY